MTWSTNVENYAKAYAATCPTGHSSKGSQYRGSDMGENLAWTSEPGEEYGVQAWYDEIKDCKSLPGCD